MSSKKKTATTPTTPPPKSPSTTTTKTSHSNGSSSSKKNSKDSPASTASAKTSPAGSTSRKRKQPPVDEDYIEDISDDDDDDDASSANGGKQTKRLIITRSSPRGKALSTPSAPSPSTSSVSSEKQSPAPAASSSKSSSKSSSSTTTTITTTTAKGASQPAAKRRRKAIVDSDEDDSDDDDVIMSEPVKKSSAPSPKPKEEADVSESTTRGTRTRRTSTTESSTTKSPRSKSSTSSTPTKSSTPVTKVESKVESKASLSSTSAESLSDNNNKKKSVTPTKSPQQSQQQEKSSTPKSEPIKKTENSSSEQQKPYVPIPVPKRPPPVSELWVDKYQPKTLEDLMGNKQGITDLKNWLSNWEEKYRNSKAEVTKGRKKTEETRSAIVSGVPGIGKTSAVKLICQACGYEVKELNASDTRSKKSLIEEIGELVNNRAIGEFFVSANKKQSQKKKKICIIMDEVDGMSAGDRGGVAELVKIIKDTRVPIICICNDRSKPALKTLISISLDVKFSRPIKTTIIKKMQQICAQEKVKVDANTLDLLVTSLGNDIRSILNNLQLLATRDSTINYNSTKKEQIEKSSAQQSIFDDISAILGSGGGNKSYEELLGLYFNDTTLVPLFVQENYIRMKPADASTPDQRLDRVAQTAESISMSDLVNAKIYSTQQFQLATVHADFSCVRPSNFMRGRFESLAGYDRYYQFPACLGKLSTTNKNLGIIRGVQKATGIAAAGNNVDMLDYMPVWRDRILSPLINNGSAGIEDTIEMLDEYGLSKDDLMNISELSSFKGKLGEDVYVKRVATATKTALTRAYNKSHKGFTKASSARKTDNCMTLEDMAAIDEEAAEEEQDESQIVDEFITKQKLNAQKAKFEKKQAAAAKKSAATASKAASKASKASSSTSKKKETAAKKPLQMKKK